MRVYKFYLRKQPIGKVFVTKRDNYGEMCSKFITSLLIVSLTLRILFCVFVLHTLKLETLRFVFQESGFEVLVKLLSASCLHRLKGP